MGQPQLLKSIGLSLFLAALTLAGGTGCNGAGTTAAQGETDPYYMGPESSSGVGASSYTIEQGATDCTFSLVLSLDPAAAGSLHQYWVHVTPPGSEGNGAVRLRA